MKFLGKLCKFLLKTILFLVVIVLVLILASPLWIGPATKSVANAVVPRFTKTAFHLGEMSFNPYSCDLTIGDMQLANPPGFTQAYAITLGHLKLDVDTATLASDTIVIDNLEIADLYFSNVKDARGVNNFDIIAENCIGTEKELEEQAQVEEEEFSFDRKIIINRFAIQNIHGDMDKLPLRVPSVELHDIGRDSGGYDLDRLIQALIKEVWASMLAAGMDVTSFVGDMAIDGVKAVGNLDVKKIQQIDLQASATNALDGTSRGAVKVLDVTTEGATDAINLTTEGATKAIDLTAEGAKKAMDGLKKLF